MLIFMLNKQQHALPRAFHIEQQGVQLRPSTPSSAIEIGGDAGTRIFFDITSGNYTSLTKSDNV